MHARHRFFEGLMCYNKRHMRDDRTDVPYFLWDYHLTGADVRRILAGKNEIERQWMMARVLSHARYEDVWKYVTIDQIVREFPKLRMRKEMTEAWKQAFTAWGYHV
ncbi:MAG: hypothetical protein V1652_00895 [bacterium]